jgi:hypothetical protein
LVVHDVVDNCIVPVVIALAAAVAAVAVVAAVVGDIAAPGGTVVAAGVGARSSVAGVHVVRAVGVGADGMLGRSDVVVQVEGHLDVVTVAR